MYNNMHLLYDLTPNHPPFLLSPPLHRRCSWNMRGRLLSSETKPTAAPCQPWTSGTSWSPSGRTCSRPSWRNASWRWVFVWLCGSLFHLFYCRPQEPKWGWLKNSKIGHRCTPGSYGHLSLYVKGNIVLQMRCSFYSAAPRMRPLRD